VAEQDPGDRSPVVGAIAASGLVPAGSSGVVMLSGGADSSALAWGLSKMLPEDSLVAFHLNYGLRADSGADESACARLCEELGVELVVECPPDGPPVGNVHQWARDLRYKRAEALRKDRGLEWTAVAHTMSDLAETVLYRLAVSPGTRPLAAMPGRRGSIIRPLLSLSRSQVREAAVTAGLGFVDDPSNDDPAFARARIRNEVMPVLEGINPAATANIARTREELAEEASFIRGQAAGLVEREPDGTVLIRAARLSGADPAVRRHALRILAEDEAGRSVPVGIERAAEASRLASAAEGGRLELGSGVSLVAEGGIVIAEDRRREAGGDFVEPVVIEVPGSARWGGWRIGAEVMEPPFVPEGPEVATLDSARLGDRVEVRSWRAGDRIRPLGMEGSKTLQDLFTDTGVRRSLRRSLPVVVAGGEIAWVPGVAVGERFRITPATRRAIRLGAGPVSEFGPAATPPRP
jgi:tRNA(Ile)-lysidine synthase